MKRILWRRWLENLFPSPRTDKNRFRTSLFLERLEDRLVPAGPFNVTSTGDSGLNTLRAAVSSAVSAGGASTINVKVSGPIKLTSGELQISNDVDLTIIGLSTLSTIDGSLNSSRLFEVYGGSTLNLQDLILTNSKFSNTTDSFSSDYGGAIHLDSGSPGGNLSLDHCQLTNNTDSGTSSNRDARGGAIYADGSNAITITNTLFKNNQAIAASYGGQGFTSGGLGEGGAISSYGGLNITDSTFSFNEAFGGSVNSGYGGNADGGAIALDGTVGGEVITRSTFDDNLAESGYGGSGQGNAQGGGYANMTFGSGGCDINDSTFASNVAESSTGVAYGGGLFLDSGDALTNDTIAFNHAIQMSIVLPSLLSGHGPDIVKGVFHQFAGENAFGGGIATGGEGGASVAIQNTIVAKNTSTGSKPNFTTKAFGSGGGLDDVGNNLVATLDEVGVFTNHDLIQPSDGPPVDPGFDPAGLKNNGGPTNTIAILNTSVAKDKGNDNVVFNPPVALAKILTDQRGNGFGRLEGAAVDIGAYEIQTVVTFKLHRGSPFIGNLSYIVPIDVLEFYGASQNKVLLALLPPSFLPVTFSLVGNTFHYTPMTGVNTPNFTFQVFYGLSNLGGPLKTKSPLKTAAINNLGIVLTVNIVFVGGRSSSEVYLGL